jgi:hypothetical protein
MFVVAGVVVVKAAAGAKILTGARPAKKAFPRIKRKLVVGAVALFILAALAALIPASDTPNAENSSAATTNSQSATEAPVSEPRTAPQMSEKEAIDAYGKVPLSFIPNEGQTDEAVRYYAQGAGYGFFFTHEGATLSFSEGKGDGHALALDFLGANPNAALTAQEQLPGEVNYLVGDDPSNWQQGLPTHAELLYGGLCKGSTWPCAERGASSSTSSTSSQAPQLRTFG